MKFAVEPRPGDKHQKFLDHVRDNLCNGDPDLYQYLMSWMARAVQKPDALGEVAVVLHGKRGTGKSLTAKIFGALFGRHFSDARPMVGNFNAHLRDCRVLLADEELWTDDEKHERVLKTLLTEETIVVEQKGVEPEVVANRVHLIMTSNAPWTAPVADGRRFFALDVTSARVRDGAYWHAMTEDLNAGGYGNLLYALQTWDISSFDHRAVPRVKENSDDASQARLVRLDLDHREDLDAARRMFGVFDNIGYAADPIAIFRTKECADEWLAWDKSRGDDRVVWCDVCVLPIDDLTGRAWNSLDPVPV